MSDYLSNLAIRSRGGGGVHPDSTTAVIQPRLASLFEPLRATGGRLAEPRIGLEGLPASSTFFNEANSDETAFDTLRPTQPLASPSAAHPLEEQSRATDWPHRTGSLHQRSEDWRARLGWGASHPTAQPASPMSADLRRAESRLEQPPAQPSPGLPALAGSEAPAQILLRRAVQPSAVTAPLQPGQDLPSPLASVSLNEPVPRSHTAAQPPHPVLEPAIQHVVIEERTGSSKELQPDAAQDESGAALPGHTIARPPRPALEPAIQYAVIEERIAALEEKQPLAIPRPELSSSTTTRSSALAPVIAQPRVTTYAKPAAPAPAEPTVVPQPGPTIQVTIGRIEVRATPHSVPPQTRSATSPVMSLDEYLNRRARGGDR